MKAEAAECRKPFLWNICPCAQWHRGAELHGQCTAFREVLILLDKATEGVFSCKTGDRLFLSCGGKEKAKHKVWRSRLQVTSQNCSCSDFWALGQLSWSSPVFPRCPGSATVYRRDYLPPVISHFLMMHQNKSMEKSWLINLLHPHHPPGNMQTKAICLPSLCHPHPKVQSSNRRNQGYVCIPVAARMSIGAFNIIPRHLERKNTQEQSGKNSLRDGHIMIPSQEFS